MEDSGDTGQIWPARCCLEFGMADASTIITSPEKQMGLKSSLDVIKRAPALGGLI